MKKVFIIHGYGGEPNGGWRPFMNTPFNFEHLKNICKSFCVIHAKDDPSVPFSHGEELSHNLSCEFVALNDGKHLNGSSGCYELPEVLECLKRIMK